MIKLRKSEERGHANHGWLDTYHTFSFASYHDPEHMRFRSLRVINEDYVAPERGFPPHDHDNMEIVTYVLDGALAHKDSMGNGSVIRPNEIQRMSAGSGITHSEFNHSKSEKVHLLQIWIFPSKRDLEPGYEQKLFPAEEKLNKLRLIGSRDGADGSVVIHQDVRLFASVLEAGKKIVHELGVGRHAWLQVTSGQITVNGQSLGAGDGAGLSEEPAVEVIGLERTEFLLFDLA
jgi:quercetin 2,3-dioxygenase